MSFLDSRNILGQAIKKSEQQRRYRARLGKGDTEKTIKVSGRSNFVWARIAYAKGIQLAQIRNTRIRNVYNAPVWVEAGEDGLLEVIKADEELNEFWENRGSPNVGEHAFSHGVYGDDPLLVVGNMMQPFLTVPTKPASLYVEVNDYIYQDWNGDYQHWTGSVDLSSYVPTGTVGLQNFVVVGVERSTNTAKVFEGSPDVYNNAVWGIKIPFTVSDVLSIAIGSDFIPSYAVRLYNNQSSIVLRDIFLDMRGHVGNGYSPISSSGGTEYTAGKNIEITVDNEIAFANPIDWEFGNLNHNHTNTGNGGTLDVAAIVSGTFGLARGGTNNDLSSVTNGSIFYTDGSKFVSVEAGDEGQVVAWNGSGIPSKIWPSRLLVERKDDFDGTTENTYAVTLPSWTTSNYTHLEFKFKLRSTNAGGATMTGYFNADSTSTNYWVQYILKSGTALSASHFTGQTFIGNIPGSGATSGLFTSAHASLDFFGDTDQAKILKSYWTKYTNQQIGQYDLFWVNSVGTPTTSAITGITFTLSAGFFTTGSVIEVYAIR